jgi:MFS family permease
LPVARWAERRDGKGGAAGGGTSPRPRLWSNVVLISLTAGFATTWYLMWSPVVPLLMATAGAAGSAIALAFAATNLASALAQYFGGRLADRIGVRRVIGLTGVALGITWLAMAAASASWLGLALFYFLGNLLFGLQMTAFVTVVSDSVPPEQRAGAFSYYWAWSAVSLVLGPILGAFLVLPHLHPPAYLALTGAVYLTVGFVRLVGLREPRPVPAVRPPPLSLVRAVRAAAGGEDRRLLLVLTAGVTVTFALTVNGPFMALVAHRLDRLPMRYVDLLFGVGAVGALVASALAARSPDPRRPLVWGLAMHAAAAAALAFPLPRVALAGAFGLAFVGFQVATVAFSTLRVALAGPQAVGEVLGATSAAAGVVAFVALYMGGLLGDRAGLALAAAVASATALWVVGRPQRAARLGARGEAAAARVASGPAGLPTDLPP